MASERFRRSGVRETGTVGSSEAMAKGKASERSDFRRWVARTVAWSAEF